MKRKLECENGEYIKNDTLTYKRKPSKDIDTKRLFLNDSIAEFPEKKTKPKKFINRNFNKKNKGTIPKNDKITNSLLSCSK